MGYTGTTNYGFQKPAKENAFTVNDLNNALDKIDETIKTEVNNLNEDINDIIDLITPKNILFPISLVDGSTYSILSNDVPIQSGDWTNPIGFSATNGTYKIILNTFGQTISHEFVISEDAEFLLEDVLCKCIMSHSIGKVTINSYKYTPLNDNDSVWIPKSSSTVSFSTVLQFGDGTNVATSNNVSITPSETTANVDFTITPVTKIVTSTTDLLIPKGKYSLFVMGGGGNGGKATDWQVTGGGGGAGYVSQNIITLESDETVHITIGSSHSPSSFGTYLSASGGGNGNKGVGGNGSAGGGGARMTNSSIASEFNGGNGGSVTDGNYGHSGEDGTNTSDMNLEYTGLGKGGTSASYAGGGGGGGYGGNGGSSPHSARGGGGGGGYGANGANGSPYNGGGGGGYGGNGSSGGGAGGYGTTQVKANCGRGYGAGGDGCDSGDSIITGAPGVCVIKYVIS